MDVLPAKIHLGSSWQRATARKNSFETLGEPRDLTSSTVAGSYVFSRKICGMTVLKYRRVCFFLENECMDLDRKRYSSLNYFYDYKRLCKFEKIIFISNVTFGKYY